MDIEKKTAYLEVANWFWGVGWKPGGFKTNLIKTFTVADQGNFERLKSAFPYIGEAIQGAQNGTFTEEMAVELWEGRHA